MVMTDKERELQEKLNAVLIDREASNKTEKEKSAEHGKAIEAMRDRLAKLEVLMGEL